MPTDPTSPDDGLPDPLTAVVECDTELGGCGCGCPCICDDCPVCGCEWNPSRVAEREGNPYA